MKRGEIIKGSKTALVTGAGSGIGRCYAIRLARLGYNIVLVGNVDEPLQSVKNEISSIATVDTLCIDLARESAADELYAWTVGRGIKVDVLINNAGMFTFCDVMHIPMQRIERTLYLHDMTLTKMCRLFCGGMIETGGGYILNMSSYSLWMPFPGLSLYSASKAYVRSFSVAFAKEVREHGVKVTAICPAGVATDLYGLTPSFQRLGMRLGVLITADSCARRGLRALWRGRRCVVPDWWNRAFIPLCMLMPKPLTNALRKFTMKYQK